ncbi:hypothetical protein CROQUDRAFT_35599 [Cronartium quercuum f. sp. fusiforme G11]|uniref:Fanconi-associated nuclease n=1 Tax=Cronartium quercuum f. sp. fusiforme G11 TaxID=708437 RepID=A0A9P6TIZ4_9BASI|nr:hypothetical protein CROQUDRAFT_35599 [Cronartium quercuum f. sp. fusiforme G11]
MVFVDPLHSPSPSPSTDSDSSKDQLKSQPTLISTDQWIPIQGEPIKKKHSAKTSQDHITTNRDEQLQTNELVPLCENNTEHDLEQEQEQEQELVTIEQKLSIYIQSFQDILNVVLENDQYLFSKSEIKILEAYNLLPNPSRYLLIRLFMRKHSKWFRIDKLINYQPEIGDLMDACEILAKPISELSHHSLTSTNSNSSPIPTTNHLLSPIASSSTLAISTPDLSVQNPTPSFTHDLLEKNEPKTSTSPEFHVIPQALNSFGFLNPNKKQRIDSPPSLDLPPISPAIPIPGPTLNSTKNSPISIKSPPAIHESNTILEKELLNCLNVIELKLLAKQYKINYHTTRDMLIKGLIENTKSQSTLISKINGDGNKKLSLKFDDRGLKQRQSSLLIPKVLKMIGHAIKLNPEVCKLFTRTYLIFSRTTSPPTERVLTAPILAKYKLRSYPNYVIERSPEKFFESRQSLIEYEEALTIENQLEDYLSYTNNSNVDKYQRMKNAHDLFQLSWSKWKESIQFFNHKHGFEIGSPKDYYRRQFHPMHILTRVVYKGAETLTYFKNYQGEVEVLVNLLRQIHFRRGKRGKWYERLAIILMNHIPYTTEEQKQQNRLYALDICERAIKDLNVHEIYKISLRKRRNKLYSLINNLSIPKLPKPYHKKSILGKRVDKHDDISTIGKKSIWFSLIDFGKEIFIEELVLEHYTSEIGWKGFHSESSIFTMLYGLIFWDVLFYPVSGAFETEFQNYPKDLMTDAFSIIREPIIKERINLIKQKGTQEIIYRLNETYKREYPKKTYCIGINWERYNDLNSLIEIIECLGIKPITDLLLLLSQEYGFRKSGVPDLW